MLLIVFYCKNIYDRHSGSPLDAVGICLVVMLWAKLDGWIEGQAWFTIIVVVAIHNT